MDRGPWIRARGLHPSTTDLSITGLTRVHRMSLLRQISKSANCSPGDRESNSNRSAAVATSIPNVVDAVAELAAARRFGQALALIDEALTKAPDNPDLLFARGSAL